MSPWYVSSLFPHTPHYIQGQDTEFPGVVARPIGTFKTSSDYHYQTMRCNVDLLKLIQIGITLADEEGNFPQDVTTWQFNFKFSIGCVLCCYVIQAVRCVFPVERTCTHQSRSSCCRNRGSIFRDTRRWVSCQTTLQSSSSPLVSSSFRKRGGSRFTGEWGNPTLHMSLLQSSRDRAVVFVYLRSDSGYDFGYLVKLLTAMTLPTSEDVFFDNLRTWFPHCYDIKFMMRACKSLKGGLQDVADDLGVRPLFLTLPPPIPPPS